MTEKSKAARPSQVTMAGWVAVVGSVLLVLTLFDAVSRLHTLEVRETVDEFLSTPPGNGLGLDIPQVVEIMRWLMLFSGAAAAAATVLAIYVLQRHNAARVGFTVAAVVIMLTAPVSIAGGFLPVMIAFSAIMLWTKPARDWFSGASPEPASSSPRSKQARDAFAAQQPRTRVEGQALSSENRPPNEPPAGSGQEAGTGASGSGDETQPWPKMPEGSADRPVPPPTQGFGTPPGQGEGQQGGPQQQAGHTFPPQPYGEQPSYGQPQGRPYGEQPPYGQPQSPPYGQQPPYGGYPPQYGQQPYGQPPYGQSYYGAPPVDPDRRPTTVAIAAWVTWALSALTLVLFVLTAFALAAGGDDLVRQVEQDPSFREQFDEQLRDITTDQILAALWVFVAVSIFWAAAAIVLAWFAYRRANWARITLVVSSAMTLLLSLLGIPFGLLHTLGAGAVIVLLFTGGANEWFTRRPAAQGYPGPFQPYGQPPQQGQQPPPYGQPPQQGQQSPHGGQPPQQGQQSPHGGQPPQQGQQPGEPPRDRGKDEPPSNVW